MNMNINKTHLGAILLGTGVFLGLTGAALVATDKKEVAKAADCDEDCDCECCCVRDTEVPTMSTDTVE